MFTHLKTVFCFYDKRNTGCH